MRITNGMIVGTTVNNLNSGLNRLSEIYEKLSTKMNFNEVSDDPINATYSMKIKSDISEVKQYQENVDDALSYSQITESAVMEVEDILQRARELLVEADNTEETDEIVKEIEQLKEQLIQLGNTTYMDEYIFSGYNTDQPLFTDDGEYNVNITSKFVDDKPAKTYQVSTGTEVEVGVNGLDIFGYEEIEGAKYIGIGEDEGDPASVGPGDTFTATEIADGDFENLTIMVNYNGEIQEIQLGSNISTLAELKSELTNQFKSVYPSDEVTATVDESSAPDYSINIQTSGTAGSDETLGVEVVQATESSLLAEFDEIIEAMNNDDIDAIGQSIEDIDAFIDDAVSALGIIGAKTNGLELTKDRLEGTNTTLTEFYSNVAIIDYAEVSMDMEMQETIYNAALAAAAKVIQPSLVDFLS